MYGYYKQLGIFVAFGAGCCVGYGSDMTPYDIANHIFPIDHDISNAPKVTKQQPNPKDKPPIISQNLAAKIDYSAEPDDEILIATDGVELLFSLYSLPQIPDYALAEIHGIGQKLGRLLSQKFPKSIPVYTTLALSLLLKMQDCPDNIKNYVQKITGFEDKTFDTYKTNLPQDLLGYYNKFTGM